MKIIKKIRKVKSKTGILIKKKKQKTKKTQNDNVLSYISPEGKMKLLTFTLHFWLKRSREKKYDKYDNKYETEQYKIKATQDQLKFER